MVLLAFQFLVLVLSLAAWAGYGPEALSLAGAAAVLLFPGTALLHAASWPRGSARDLLLGPALSPLLLGLTVVVALRTGTDPRLAVSVLTGVCGLFVVLSSLFDGGRPRREDGVPPPGTWTLALLAALLVGFVLLPSEWRRMTSDAWFHIAVVEEMARSGIPPEDPYFAGLSLQYFWFFHAVLLGFRAASGLGPAGSMALLNIAAAALCVVAATRLARGMEVRPTEARWAGALFLLGMGGLFWAFLPFKLLTLFVGEVRGREELAEIFRLTPFTPETTALFTQFLGSSDFVLRKFLVGTAASWSLLLSLLAADAGIRWIRDRLPRDAAVLFLTVLGALLFHVILGGASGAALAGSALLLAATGRDRRGPAFLAFLLPVLAAATAFPYLHAVTEAKEADHFLPIGVNLRSWIALVPTLLGVFLLSLPVLRAWGRHGRGTRAYYLGWTLWAGFYALFARLPGPNQFDKPPLVLYLPLAVAAGIGIPRIWRRLAGRPGLRALFALGLLLMLVPGNALRYGGYVAEREAPPLSPAETALYSWITERSPRDAVFFDSGDRVDVLVRGPRRQVWGKEAYAEQWGYDRNELERRRRIRDALYAPTPLPPDVEAKLDGFSDPVFVVVREQEVPGTLARLRAHPRFRRVFRQDGIALFRWVPPGSRGG